MCERVRLGDGGELVVLSSVFIGFLALPLDFLPLLAYNIRVRGNGKLRVSSPRPPKNPSPERPMKHVRTLVAIRRFYVPQSTVSRDKNGKPKMTQIPTTVRQLFVHVTNDQPWLEKTIRITYRNIRVPLQEKNQSIYEERFTVSKKVPRGWKKLETYSWAGIARELARYVGVEHVGDLLTDLINHKPETGLDQETLERRIENLVA